MAWEVNFGRPSETRMLAGHKRIQQSEVSNFDATLAMSQKYGAQARLENQEEIASRALNELSDVRRENAVLQHQIEDLYDDSDSMKKWLWRLGIYAVVVTGLFFLTL